jgi:DNA-binding NarL/FixJ family response regulator
MAATLTPQEIRVVELLAQGYSYQGAAQRMNVSVNTVRNYIRAVYDKLHVHTKSEAVSKAMRDGLV